MDGWLRKKERFFLSFLNPSLIVCYASSSNASSSSSFSLFSLAHRKPMVNVHSDTHYHYVALYCPLSLSAVLSSRPKKIGWSYEFPNVDNLLAWYTVYGAFLLWPYDGPRGKVWGSFLDRKQSDKDAWHRTQSTAGIISSLPRLFGSYSNHSAMMSHSCWYLHQSH